MKLGQRRKKDSAKKELTRLPSSTEHLADQQKLFSETLREELNKERTFRRKDGTLLTTTELRLIAIKVINELRTTTPVNSRLLDIVLNRIEGKPKEFVEIDGTMEVMNGLSAQEILLQRLSHIIGPPADEGADTKLIPGGS